MYAKIFLFTLRQYLIGQNFRRTEFSASARWTTFPALLSVEILSDKVMVMKISRELKINRTEGHPELMVDTYERFQIMRVSCIFMIRSNFMPALSESGSEISYSILIFVGTCRIVV